MFDRDLVGGSTGNASAGTQMADFWVSPTGASFGRLDAEQHLH
jgi:ribulose-5-phosphate 4-epimerase/fuculose-1-phosphate aldolase